MEEGRRRRGEGEGARRWVRREKKVNIAERRETTKTMKSKT